VIPAHTRLSLHHHPGTQVAYVRKGTLTYTVESGVVKIFRGAADQDPRHPARHAVPERRAGRDTRARVSRTARTCNASMTPTPPKALM